MGTPVLVVDDKADIVRILDDRFQRQWGWMSKLREMEKQPYPLGLVFSNDYIFQLEHINEGFWTYSHAAGHMQGSDFISA